MTWPLFRENVIPTEAEIEAAKRDAECIERMARTIRSFALVQQSPELQKALRNLHKS